MSFDRTEMLQASVAPAAQGYIHSGASSQIILSRWHQEQFTFKWASDDCSVISRVKHFVLGELVNQIPFEQNYLKKNWLHLV